MSERIKAVNITPNKNPPNAVLFHEKPVDILAKKYIGAIDIKLSHQSFKGGSVAMTSRADPIGRRYQNLSNIGLLLGLFEDIIE